MGTANSLIGPVVLFDGVCNLCNSSVQFIIKRDKEAKLKYASLQSDFAKSNLPAELTDEENLQSFVLIEDGKLLTKSSAALSISRKLSGGWPMLYAFIIVPKFIRDFIYSIVAKNRYKWFGKRDECMIPTPELKARFLD